MKEGQTGQWANVADVFLSAVGHPLRPIDADLKFFKNFCEPILKAEPQARVLILGVTPELQALFPSTCQVKAMDRTPDMIEHVWPGEVSDVIQKNWLNLSEVEEKFDLILLDSGLHLVGYPEEQSSLLLSILDRLKFKGRFVVRLFTPPPERESVEEVFLDFKQGKIRSVNHLKIRLGNALQQSPNSGVVLNDLWEKVDRDLPELLEIGSQLGWSKMELKALDFYKGLEARYSFVTVAEVEDLV